MTDRLLAWLTSPRPRLAELQAIEEDLHLCYDALPQATGRVDKILHEAALEALNLYLEVVELGYDHLELGADRKPGRELLAEACAAMSRYDSLVDQLRQGLAVPLERGTG